MLRRFYVIRHLLVEAFTARRDARIRFVKAEVDILRRKFSGNRVSACQPCTAKWFSPDTVPPCPQCGVGSRRDSLNV